MRLRQPSVADIHCDPRTAEIAAFEEAPIEGKEVHATDDERSLQTRQMKLAR